VSVPVGLLIAIVLGLIPAAIASGKGRSFIGWWLFGSLLWIIALPLALIIGKDDAELEKRQLANGGVRKCPHCAELVKAGAKICRYCQRPLGEEEAAAQTKISAPPLYAAWLLIAILIVFGIILFLRS